MDLAIEVLGWCGSALVLGAYVLAARGVWPASSARSAAVNVVGAALLTVNGWHHGALPSVFVNTVWMLIGVATILGLTKPAPLPRGD
jgi:hypothetical protein